MLTVCITSLSSLCTADPEVVDRETVKRRETGRGMSGNEIQGSLGGDLGANLNHSGF